MEYVIELNADADGMIVPLGRKAKYGTLLCNIAAFPANVREHVFMYGLRQIINDAIADKTDDDGNDLTDRDIVAKAAKRLDTLLSGDLRVARDLEPVDPVEAALHAMAKKAIRAMMAKTDDYKAIKPEKGKDRVLAALQKRNGADMTWDAAIAKFVAANPKMRAEAVKMVKEANAAIAAVGL